MYRALEARDVRFRDLDPDQIVSSNVDNVREGVCFSIRTDVTVYQLFLLYSVTDEIFQVITTVPQVIGENVRRDVAEAVVRANHGLRLGKLEFDMEDGSLTYCCAQIVTPDGVGISEDVIDALITISLRSLDAYLPAINSIIYANEPPKDAIAQADNGLQARLRRMREELDDEGDDNDGDRG
jgi:hypothetical protein